MLSINKRIQKSTKGKIWFDLPVTLSEDGISIPAGSFWFQGVEYNLSAIAEDFPDGARLWIEKTIDGADYYLDTTTVGEP